MVSEEVERSKKIRENFQELYMRFDYQCVKSKDITEL